MSTQEELNYALFCALDDNELENAKLLVTQGAEVHRITPVESWSLLHKIMMETDVTQPAPIECLKFLIEQGLDVNGIHYGGYTPLIYAARRKSAESIRVLLENGATKTVNHKNESGVAPLQMAMGTKPYDYDSIKTLLEFGADPDLPNRAGNTPRRKLDIAVGIPEGIKALFAKY